MSEATSITRNSPGAGACSMSHWFWMFAALHLAAWTLLPLALYTNLPLDTVEMHSWGQKWQWGYHKHPPLPAWIARAASQATPGSPLGIYVTQQLCMVACFWAAWRLGGELLSSMTPRAALLGALLLECCHFYTFESTILNNNTVLYAAWALASLFFYWSLARGRSWHWAGLGLLMGLGLLTKYTMLILALVMLVFLIAHPRARPVWRTAGPYLAAAVALAVFAPHLYWAWMNDFTTLSWMSARAETSAGLAGHVTNPLRFAGSQLIAIAPVAAACLPLTGLRWRLRPVRQQERFSRSLLLALTLGPFALHLLLSLLLNWRLRSIWGCHLWSFAGLAILFCIVLRTEARRWRQAISCCIVLAVLMFGVRVARTVIGGRMGHPHRELFLGTELAQSVEKFWNDRFDRPLAFVAGDAWLAGSVAFFAPSQPEVYGIMNADAPPSDPRLASGLNDRDMAAAGGVYLWNDDIDSSRESLTEMKARFPRLVIVGRVVARYANPNIPTENIGVAIVPPETATVSRHAARQR